MKKVKLVFASMAILMSSLLVIFGCDKKLPEESNDSQTGSEEMVKLRTGGTMFTLYTPLSLAG